jgi:hypothetical protein
MKLRIDNPSDGAPNPANRGVTYSDDPKHPLWHISVKFPDARPMKELIKAPSKQAAKSYAQLKYPTAVISLVDTKPVRISIRPRTTGSQAAS